MIKPLLFKALVYRILASGVTMTAAYFITGSVELAGTIVIFEFVGKIMFYAGFDYVWRWGRIYLRGPGSVIWLTGLPCSGKTTIAKALGALLSASGKRVEILDGDELRHTLCSDLGFSDEDRAENLRRVKHLAKMKAKDGSVVICAFVSPSGKERESVRNHMREIAFYEVFVKAPAAICAKRDVKGMWDKAFKGEIKGFTGYDAPYEIPLSPEVTLDTLNYPLKECVQKLASVIAKG
jgi:adenylyl-sulfate kinase